MLCLSGFELYSRWVPLKVVLYFLKWGIKVPFHRQILCDFDAILGQILNQPCERAVFSWPVVTITTFTTAAVAITFRGANRAGPICCSFYSEQSDCSICVSKDVLRDTWNITTANFPLFLELDCGCYSGPNPGYKRASWNIPDEG